MTLDQILGDSQFGLLGFNIGLLFMQVMLFAVSLFMILLVLVQRGKGGGLTGALGGMGGQSAFGSKAGDAFTKITVVTAVIWITLCMITIAGFNPPPPPKSLSKQTDNQSGAVSDDGATTDPSVVETNAGGSGTEEKLPGETDADPALPGDSGAVEKSATEPGGLGIDLEGPSAATEPAAAGAGSTNENATPEPKK